MLSAKPAALAPALVVSAHSNSRGSQRSPPLGVTRVRRNRGAGAVWNANTTLGAGLGPGNTERFEIQYKLAILCRLRVGVGGLLGGEPGLRDTLSPLWPKYGFPRGFQTVRRSKPPRLTSTMSSGDRRSLPRPHRLLVLDGRHDAYQAVMVRPFGT